jgi:hypothetical protein
MIIIIIITVLKLKLCWALHVAFYIEPRHRLQASTMLDASNLLV